MKRLHSILWGIALVVLGVVLALNALDITDASIFFDGWWTLFIIVPSGIGLLTERDKVGSIIGMCIGVFLLLCCRDILSFGLFWKLLVPAVIVIIGIKMIFANFFRKQGVEVYKRLVENGTEIKNGTATFSGTNLSYDNEVFEGAELNAIFGGVKCDLRGAIISGDCVINATAVFGGITLYVPEELNIKINSTSLFGGVSEEYHRKNQADRNTLYLNTTCLFGGVEIK